MQENIKGKEGLLVGHNAGAHGRGQAPSVRGEYRRTEGDGREAYHCPRLPLGECRRSEGLTLGALGGRDSGLGGTAGKW